MQPIGQVRQVQLQAVHGPRDVRAVKITRMIYAVGDRIDQRIVVHRISFPLDHRAALLQRLLHRPQALRRAAQRVGALNRFVGRRHGMVPIGPPVGLLHAMPDIVQRNRQLRIEQQRVEHLRHGKLAGMMLRHVDRRMIIIGRRAQSFRRHGQRSQRQPEQIRRFIHHDRADARHHRGAVKQRQPLLRLQIQTLDAFVPQSLRGRRAASFV